MTELLICSVCGKPHAATDIEFTFKRPDDFVLIPVEARDIGAQSSDDLCAIWGDSDAQHRYFVRGLLPLPVAEWSGPYSLGVWLEVSKVDFDRIRERWDDVDQSCEPAMPASLANSVPFHPKTCGLSGLLQLTGPDTRPEFKLID